MGEFGSGNVQTMWMLTCCDDNFIGGVRLVRHLNRMVVDERSAAIDEGHAGTSH